MSSVINKICKKRDADIGKILTLLQLLRRVIECARYYGNHTKVAWARPLPSGEHAWAKKLRLCRKLVSGADLALTVAITFYLFGGSAENWAYAIQRNHESPWARALLFSLILSVVYGVPSFPLAFIKSYVIEEHFGLSTQTPMAWLIDYAKGMLIGGVLGAVVVTGLTAVLLWGQMNWWWMAAIGAAAFGIILTRVAPQLIVPIFFKMKPLESPELVTRFTELAKKTGTPILGVFEIDMSRRTKAANAAVIGFGASRRAVVGDTLLSQFSVEEVEFVLAHELGHHHHHDLWSGVAVSALTTLICLGIAHFTLSYRTDVYGKFILTSTARATFNPLIIYYIAVMTTVSGMLLGPIGKWFSRYVEARADRFAAATTKDAAAGAKAFRKLGFQNLAVFSHRPGKKFCFIPIRPLPEE